ncbi:hypothetical protein ACFWBR_24335 [Streptomyces sp. NPDC060006]
MPSIRERRHQRAWYSGVGFSVYASPTFEEIRLPVANVHLLLPNEHHTF